MAAVSWNQQSDPPAVPQSEHATASKNGTALQPLQLQANKAAQNKTTMLSRACNVCGQQSASLCVRATEAYCIPPAGVEGKAVGSACASLLQLLNIASIGAAHSSI